MARLEKSETAVLANIVAENSKAIFRYFGNGRSLLQMTYIDFKEFADAFSSLWSFYLQKIYLHLVKEDQLPWSEKIIKIW